MSSVASGSVEVSRTRPSDLERSKQTIGNTCHARSSSSKDCPTRTPRSISASLWELRAISMSGRNGVTLARLVRRLDAILAEVLDHERMVEQVCANARSVSPDSDADLTEVGLGSDAGPHQDRRRAVGASRQDDLCGAIDVAVAGTNAHGPIILDLDSIDHRVRKDGEIGAGAGGREVRERCIHPDPIGDVLRPWADRGTLVASTVEVDDDGEAQPLSRRRVGLIDGTELAGSRAPHRNRAVASRGAARREDPTRLGGSRATGHRTTSLRFPASPKRRSPPRNLAATCRR